MCDSAEGSGMTGLQRQEMTEGAFAKGRNVTGKQNPENIAGNFAQKSDFIGMKIYLQMALFVLNLAMRGYGDSFALIHFWKGR